MRESFGVFILAKARENIKKFIQRVNFPIGEYEDVDKKDLDKFLKFVDKIITISYFIFGIVSAISIYLFVTKEIL